MAMMRLLISLMSDHGKPWAIESDSTPSLPSIADSLSTKPRIGWRVVWNTPIMRQSQAAITGLVRPSMAPSITVNRSSARSDTSTCGYSLNSTSAVASRNVPSPMLQWRSSSTPTGTSRADDLADMGEQVAFAVVVALGHHGAVHGQEHAHRPASRP